MVSFGTVYPITALKDEICVHLAVLFQRRTAGVVLEVWARVLGLHLEGC